MGRSKQVNPTPNIGVENRIEIDRIGDEWRMNVQQTIAALIALWSNSTDEQRVNAIRVPADKRELQSA